MKIRFMPCPNCQPVRTEATSKPRGKYICPKCSCVWRLSRPTKRAPDAEEAAASQSVSNTETLSTSDSVPQSASARVA